MDCANSGGPHSDADTPTHDGTAVRCGQERDHPLRPVRQVNGQPVARVETQPAERLGERHGFTGDLRVGHPA